MPSGWYGRLQTASENGGRMGSSVVRGGISRGNAYEYSFFVWCATSVAPTAANCRCARRHWWRHHLVAPPQCATGSRQVVLILACAVAAMT